MVAVFTLHARSPVYDAYVARGTRGQTTKQLAANDIDLRADSNAIAEPVVFSAYFWRCWVAVQQAAEGRQRLGQTMRRHLALPSLLLLLAPATSLIPSTPGEQTRRAIASIRETISRSVADDVPPRLYVDYLIPLPVETKAEDIDPWPGGLAQQYPYAEDIVKEILAGVVEGSTSDDCSTQIVSETDCCGLYIQQSPESARNDVACLVFASPDQYDEIKNVEAMVGPRPLVLFNRQFQRPEDFGFFRKGEASEVLSKYTFGYAFQEIACRGEDVKLTFERDGGWEACVVDEKGNEIELKDDGWDPYERPRYEDLERKINEVLPEPLWLRMIGEAQEKGMKFQRKE